jgi:translation initiation factor 1
MATSKKIPTDGGTSFGHNPFGALSSDGLPPAPADPAVANPGGASVPASRAQHGETEPSRLVGSLAPPSETRPAGRKRGRVDILRVKAGRGGKTVTVAKNFVGIGLPEKEQLAKAMQKACGSGGTVKNGQIEIQGDKRAEVARILSEAGFQPVFAGG